MKPSKSLRFLTAALSMVITAASVFTAHFTASAAVTAPEKPDNIVKEFTLYNSAVSDQNMILMDSIVAYNNFAWNVPSQAVDCSGAQYVELDLYVEDFAKFSVAKNGNEKAGVYMKLKKGGDWEWKGIHDYITKDGWNHAKFEIPEGVSVTEFGGFEIGPWESFGGKFGVANVCFTKDKTAVVAPEKPDNIVKEFTLDNKSVTDQNMILVDSMNAYQNFAWKTFDPAIDCSGAQYVELDLYVEDFAKFSIAKNGNEKAGIFMKFLKNGGHEEVAIHDYITKDGWNHARFAIPSGIELSEFVGFEIGPWESFGGKIGVANVCFIKGIENPAMPGNVVYTVDEKGFGYSSWNGELVFKEYGDNVYDLSDCKYFEADLYISEDDYEIYSNNPQAIGFSLGSNENKWQDRSVFQGKLNLKQAGWNHFKISLEDSSYWEGTPDLTAVQKVLIYHEGMHEIDPVTVRFANICFTSGPQDIGPDDGQTEKRPDSNAYYLTDCESLVDSLGSWNSAGNYQLDTANRTEGDYSVRMSFNSLYNSIRYNRNAGLDLSKAEKLKFDLFIGNEEVMNEFVDGFMIRLASDGNYRKNYAYANIDKASLHAGWNTIEISLADMQSEGTVNLANIDTFGLFSVNGTFGEFDELTVKIDNVRLSGQVTVLESGSNRSDGSSFDDSFTDDSSDSDIPKTGETPFVIPVLLSAVSAAAVLLIFFKRKATK